MNLKRVFLISLLISLAAGAMLGVIGILSPGWREQDRLIGSMMSVGLFSVTLLGTAIVLDKQQWRGLMFVSLGISGLGLLFFLFMIWLGESIEYESRRNLRRLMFNFAAIGVAIPLAGLLSLTRFRYPALSLARVIGITLVFITGAVYAVVVWGDFPSNYLFEFLSILAIVTVLAIIGLPLLHKLAGMPPPGETVAQETEIQLTCPRCSLPQTLKSGQARCARCRLRIKIEVEEPRCPKCDYLLYELTEPRCPECGESLDVDEVVQVANPTESATPATPSHGNA